MHDPMLLITETPSGLALIFADQLIPLPLNHTERHLSNTFLSIRSGIAPHKIATHILNHSTADNNCPCCKLEGRVRSAQGRSKPPTQNSQTHIGGRTIIRHIKPGLSGAQLLALEERRAFHSGVRASRALGIIPPPQKRVKRRIEDLI